MRVVAVDEPPPPACKVHTLLQIYPRGRIKRARARPRQASRRSHAKVSWRGYRVLHFATQGLLAGESEEFLKAKAEPALLLKPPKELIPSIHH